MHTNTKTKRYEIMYSCILGTLITCDLGHFGARLFQREVHFGAMKIMIKNNYYYTYYID